MSPFQVDMPMAFNQACSTQNKLMLGDMCTVTTAEYAQRKRSAAGLLSTVSLTDSAALKMFSRSLECLMAWPLISNQGHGYCSETGSLQVIQRLSFHCHKKIASPNTSSAKLCNGVCHYEYMHLVERPWMARRRAWTGCCEH